MAAEQQEERHESFIKKGSGLTSIPAKIMAIPDLEVLDLSQNQIEVVPKGLFPDIDKLKRLILSHNNIRCLPEDIAALKLLEVLHVGHNKLTALPDALYSLATVQELDACYNRIVVIQDNIGQMEALHVLNLAGNKLRCLPCDVGWLGLKQLNVSDNPDLNIPAHVMQCGFTAVLSYLQIVGEQHQLVSRHMELFTAKIKELQLKQGLVLGPLQDESSVALRRRIASKFGILTCSNCQLTALQSHLADRMETAANVQVLDLSYNRLKDIIPQLLQSLPKLLVANLSFNILQSFPAAVNLATLAVLNLSFNKLTSLPEGLGTQLPALQQLYLTNNHLTGLPDSLAVMPLHDLFLSENALQQVPQVLQRCTGLMKLSLAACELTNIADELNGLTGLRFLDISFNKLQSLPASFGSLCGVERLNLGFNPLQTFPDALTTLTDLKELNMDHTGITTFPEGLGVLRQLEGLQADGCHLQAPFNTLYDKDPLLLVKLHDTQLSTLDLSDAGLEVVPEQLNRMTQLTGLNLLRNSIKDLSQHLGNLRQLQQLSLKGNPLRQPYLKIMDAKGELALPVFLRAEGAAGVLDLEGCGFDHLPKEVWELPGRVEGLVQIKLTNNRLVDVPNELSILTNLTQLVLDNNLLRQFPDVVLSLPSLAILMASNNNITHVPESISTAQRLQALIMHSNEITQLPDATTSLTNLRALGLTSNKLWTLPDGLAECGALRLLDCSHNLLSRLPEGLGRLQKLRTLKLTHNKLRWIPVDDLRELPALAELHLVGNIFTVGIEMNACDPASVQRLLAALADTPAAREPPAQQTYSRNTSNAYASSFYAPNANSVSSTGMADSNNRSHSPARSRFGDAGSRTGSGLSSPTAAAAVAARRDGATWAGKFSDSFDSRQSCDIGAGSTAGPALATDASAAAPGLTIKEGGNIKQAQGSRLAPPEARRRSATGSNRTTTDSDSVGRRSKDSIGVAEGRRSSATGSIRTTADRDGSNLSGRRSTDSVRVPLLALVPVDLTQQGQEAACQVARKEAIAATTVAAGSTSVNSKSQSADLPGLPVTFGSGNDVRLDTAQAVAPQPVQNQREVPTAQPVADASKAPQQQGQVAGNTSAPAATAAPTAAPLLAAASGIPAERPIPALPANPAGALPADGNTAIGTSDSVSPAVITSPSTSTHPPAGKLTWKALAAQAEPALSPISEMGHGASGWDKIPLMDLPRIIKSLTIEPPPPPTMQPQQQLSAQATDGLPQPARRPQSKARFQRVIEQTAKAMEILEKMAAAGVNANSEGHGNP